MKIDNIAESINQSIVGHARITGKAISLEKHHYFFIYIGNCVLSSI